MYVLYSIDYSQVTCPLSNPDNLFGIGLFYFDPEVIAMFYGI